MQLCFDGDGLLGALSAAETMGGDYRVYVMEEIATGRVLYVAAPSRPRSFALAEPALGWTSNLYDPRHLDRKPRNKVMDAVARYTTKELKEALRRKE